MEIHISIYTGFCHETFISALNLHYVGLSLLCKLFKSLYESVCISDGSYYYCTFMTMPRGDTGKEYNTSKLIFWSHAISLGAIKMVR